LPPQRPLLEELTERIDRIDEELQELDARELGAEEAQEAAADETEQAEPTVPSPSSAEPKSATEADNFATDEGVASGLPQETAPLRVDAAPPPRRRSTQVRPDDVEATVTFVLKEPKGSLLQAAQLPADLGTERKTQLFERLREAAQGEASAQGSEAFVPVAEPAEEAEVRIVTPAGEVTHQARSSRPSSVNRFLKALSGG
jgi:hypothetical protein